MRKFQVILILAGLTLAMVGCKQPTKQNETDPIQEGIDKIVEQIELPEIPDEKIILSQFSDGMPDTTGSYDFQADIEKAIAQLDGKGGGTLVFDYPESLETGNKPVVTYRVKGPIELRSNIGLSFDRSVKLQFEFDPPSYRPGGKGVIRRYEGTTLYTHSPLIRAFNCENISITCNGGVGSMPVINGDGRKWRDWEVQGNRERKGGQTGQQASYMMVKDINQSGIPIRERRFDEEYLRPLLIQFFLCKKVLVEDVKLENSPFWTVHPLYSEGCTFRGIEFEALVANNDGIDPESSRNVLIEGYYFKVSGHMSRCDVSCRYALLRL